MQSRSGFGVEMVKATLEIKVSDGTIILKCALNKQDGAVVDWSNLAQDRDRRRALVNAVMNFRVR